MYRNKAPSLVDFCVQKAIDNVRYLGDVGETDSYLLERILPHCTLEQLMHVEKSTAGRDLTPVTDKLWKKFYEMRFGTQNTDIVIERMRQKKVNFKWLQLYEAKLKDAAEAENQAVDRIYGRLLQQREPEPLRANPTMAQIKIFEEEKAKKPKALSCIYAVVSNNIFSRIMTCSSPKEAWNKLKEEFEGSDRVKAIKLLTLKREFEMLKIKESETVKDYAGKLIEAVNKIRLTRETFEDDKVVDKILISLPARFEAKVSAIEESCGLKRLSISELISKLEAHEQRSSMRKEEEAIEGAFQAKEKGKQPVRDFKRGNGEKGWKNKKNHQGQNSNARGKFPPCGVCQRTNHEEKDCFFKGKSPIQCRFCQKLGHIEKYCRAKQAQQPKQQQPAHQANFVDDQEPPKDVIFMASQSSHESNMHTWFIDSGCTNHMARYLELFDQLDSSVRTKIKHGNGEIVEAEGK